MWGCGAREQCGNNEGCTASIPLKNLTTSLVWTGGGGKAGGRGRRGARQQCGSNEGGTGSTR